MDSSTLQFYRSNALALLHRYNTADMSTLHHRLLAYLPEKSKVVDIGFGSGRDLTFLHSHGFDVYGIDPTDAFVAEIQDRLPEKTEHFRVGSFLSPNTPDNWQNSFDTVISIAAWMHLRTDEHPEAIKNIRSLLKPKGVVILSFSLGKRRSNDGRHFEPLALNDVVNAFRKEGFSLIASESMQDALGRDSLQWATVVLKQQPLNKK